MMHRLRFSVIQMSRGRPAGKSTDFVILFSSSLPVFTRGQDAFSQSPPTLMVFR
jgi:hypothetical protein